MNDLTLRERLQLSLLARLTDDEPGNLQEGTDKRVFIAEPAEKRG